MPEFVHEDGTVLGAPAGSELEEALENKTAWTRVGGNQSPATDDDAAPDAEGEPDADAGSELASLSRGELNELAESVGVANPAQLANKAAVIAAIESADDPDQDTEEVTANG